MKLLLPIASLFLLSIVSGQEMDLGTLKQYEDELFECLKTLACVRNKVDDFYNTVQIAGPQNYQKYVDVTREVGSKFDLPGNQEIEFWTAVKDIMCELPEKKQKKLLMEAGEKIGDYSMEVCQDEESEPCVLMQLAGDEGMVKFAEYRAAGDCPLSGEIPALAELESRGGDKMPAAIG